MNQVILVGNVGKSECRYTTTGKCVCTFSVATSHGWKDKDGKWQNETSWHNCVKFLKHESEAPQKGDKVFVEGSINYRTYEKDGATRYVTEIKVANFFNAPKTESSVPDFVNQDINAFTKEGKFDDTNIPF